LIAGWLSWADSPAAAHHFMCSFKVEKRTQSVSIDPALVNAGVTREAVIAAFEPWNQLFNRYHGFPIFAEHAGDWWEADIVITSNGDAQTWVQTPCNQSYLEVGANKAIVYLGRGDAWRNQEMLAHELGHALGLADHGDHLQQSSGHIGFAHCDLSYIGVMSYCTGTQSWFRDLSLPGSILDGQLVSGYW
jgi:hypothetical protein